MVARRFLSWPSYIKEITRQPRSRIFRNRSTESEGGINDSAQMRRAQKRSYQNQYVIPYEPSYDRWRNAWNWLAPSIKGQSARIWYKEGSERWYERIRSGPPADGAREAFPAPLRSASDGPYMYVNGEWDSSAIISTLPANMLTDNQAISDTDLTGLTAVGSCALSRVSAYRYYYGRSVQATPAGTTSNFGWKTDVQPCLPTWPTTGVFWATGPSSLSVKAQVAFFDGSLIQVGSTADGTPVSLVPGEWTPISVSTTSPGTAVYVVVWGLCTTSTNLPWWSDCRGAVLLSDPWWWVPSESPPVGLLSAPPAAGSLVEVAGSGLWQALCMPASDAIQEEERPMGHVYPSLDLVEVWEPATAWQEG